MLALAADSSLPLLERAKFLAIFASNLDEFYMVVAGPETSRRDGFSVRHPTRREQPGLRSNPADLGHGMRGCSSIASSAGWRRASVIVTWADLTAAERKELSTYFQEQVFPVLTRSRSTLHREGLSRMRSP